MGNRFAGIATGLQVKAAAQLIGCCWQAAILPLNRQLRVANARTMHESMEDGSGPILYCTGSLFLVL